LVEAIFGKSAGTAAPICLRWAELRQACLAGRADKFFPVWWQRAEGIREKAAADAPGPAEYYLAMIQLAAAAGSPPEGMVFVPGGHVTFATAKGPRKVWVEPFFLDRCETTVAAYAAFQAAAAAVQKLRDKAALFRPIAAAKGFAAGDLPVTGVSWHAADAFARWQGKRLPKVLEWLRAAAGDDGREYPCGGADSAGKCNLKGAADGFAILAPAAACGADTGSFGLVGLTGNVREWTASWFAEDAFVRSDAAGAAREPATGVLKYIAGGSWRTRADAARCGTADKAKPGEAFDDVGFRCAADFLPAEERQVRVWDRSSR